MCKISRDCADPWESSDKNAYKIEDKVKQMKHVMVIHQ